MLTSRSFPPASAARGEPEHVWGQLVSSNYFSVVGVRPALGRGILPEEDKVIGRDQVVVLSQAVWRRRFGSDPGIIGREIPLNGQRYTVVGVAPRGFALSLALGRFATSLLYGLSGTDRLTLGAVSIGLLVVALPASLFPAYRAAHVEPASALHYE